MEAEWTYELAPGGADTVWLEEYLVYDAAGEPAGKVFAVLEHDGDRYLGIEREPGPLRHDRRAVPFDAIAELDHENLAVHLRLGPAGLDRALELDPGKGVEQGGEARRIVDVPQELVPPPGEPGLGPVDRPRIVAAPILGLLAVMSFLLVIVFYSAHTVAWRLAFLAIPVVLALAALATMYAAWARPWRRNGAHADRRRRGAHD